jgi:hypothetical protein
MFMILDAKNKINRFRDDIRSLHRFISKLFSYFILLCWTYSLWRKVAKNSRVCEREKVTLNILYFAFCWRRWISYSKVFNMNWEWDSAMKDEFINQTRQLSNQRTLADNYELHSHCSLFWNLINWSSHIIITVLMSD